ncbi:tRNA threonylcarbamoyladenosine dehydratase [Inediibacterium massiliense]|uniref:tRNA threonylcarbamoyladenosine dehydratase n=1 Tax=Inediibacterium massiliense TaxID=1658111 RepID=UPI0006B42377|nr:tRNA threonylcarbamoyladenosine dehydratase [Inediibacterium massiliense]
MELHAFSRTEMIIGTENLNKLKESKVAVFGIGGVGTFVVEGLARSGVGHLVLVDHDDICITNVNRQIHALRDTIGQSKVEIMKKRILQINPNAKVQTYKMLYTEKTASELLKDDYDYVVDAIDMVSAKLDLIERCYKRGIKMISSMGTGNKLDPTQFEVTDIYKTSICPLAKVIRKELRKREVKSLKVVYSKEEPIKPNTFSTERKQVPGSMSFVPSVAGMIIASVVVKDLIKERP